MSKLNLIQGGQIRRAKGSGRRAVICSIDWLETYLASEHFHFVRILHEEHGFDVVDSINTSFYDEKTAAELNKYELLLTPWQGHVDIQPARVAGP